MAIVNGIPGFTQLTKLNVTEILLEDGNPVLAGDTSLLVDGVIPQAVSGILTSSGITVDQDTGVVTFDNSIIVPSGSIQVGQVLELSEGIADLVIVDLLKDAMAFSVNADFDDATGSSVPNYIDFGAAETLNINIDDSETLTDNPLTFSISGTVVAPNVRLIDKITLRTGSAMTNFTAEVVDNATGLAIRYIPSQAAFDGDEDGLDLVSGDNIFNFTTNADSSAGVFNLGFIPFLVEENQLLDFTIQADSVDILGNASGIPYLVAENHDGPPVNLVSTDVTLTEGSVLFADSSGVIAQDNDNLFWNDTANVLEPSNLSVEGLITFEGDSSTQSMGATRSSDDWHVASAILKQSFSTTTQDNEPESLFFRSDGLKMYLAGSQNGLIYEYDLSTSWDVLTAVFLQSFDPSMTNIAGVFFRPSGLQMFLINVATDEVEEFVLTTAWDVSTASTVQTIDLGSLGGGTIPHDLYFRNDGLIFYISEISNLDIEQYNMTTPWDISTATLTTTFTTGVTDFSGSFKLDGTIMYAISGTGVISEYNLTTPWLVDTAELVNTFDATLTSVRGIFFKTDGSKFYITNEGTDVIGEYNVGLDIAANLNLRIADASSTVAVRFLDESNVTQATVSYSDALQRFQLESQGSELNFGPNLGYVTSGGLFITAATGITATATTGDISLTSTVGDIDLLPGSGLTGVNIGDPVSTLHVYENTGSVGQAAGLTVEQDGAGDAVMHFVLTGAQDWTIGVDNSLSDSFAIAPALNLTNVAPLQILVTGEIGINKTPRANHCLDINTDLSTIVGLYDQKDVTLEQANSINANSTDLFFNRADVGFNQSEFYIFNNNDNVPSERLFHMNYTDAGTVGGLSVRYSGFVAVGIGENDDADTLLHLRSEGADTVAIETLETTGTNGALVTTFVGDQDPTGVVTGSPGDIYRRSSGVNSSEFIHQGASANNTDWVETTTNMANANLTLTGTRIHELDGNPFIIEEGGSVVLSLSGGQQQLKFNANIFHVDSTGIQLDSEAGSEIQIISAGADTEALHTLDTAGTNGAEKSVFVGDRDPNGNVTGAGGDEYNRVSATTSASYESIEATTGTEWLKRATFPSTTVMVNSSAEFEALATASTITVTDKLTIILNVDIVSTTVFDIQGPDGDLHLLSFNDANFVSTSTGTIFTIGTDAGAQLAVDRVDLLALAGCTWFDVTGGINILDTTRIELLNMVIFDGALGSFSRLAGFPEGPVFNVTNCLFLDRDSGFDFEDTAVNITRSTVTQLSGGTSSAPFATIKTTVIDPPQFNFTNSNNGLSSGESMFRVDPGLVEGSRVLISGISTEFEIDAGGLFDTSGATGTFTAVADASIAATAITSVTDSSGVARFNHAGTDPFVNQEVVISGFTTNTDYNQTAFVTTTGAGFFEVDYIAFGTTETGSFLSDSVTMTDTGTSLVDGDTIKLDTDDSTDYDSGARVYNQLTNTFQVNKAFTATQTGTWSQAGLNQTDPLVLANNNPEFEPSHYIATAFVNDNSQSNSAIINNVFTDIDFGTVGTALIVGSTMERWKLINEVTGVFEYTGVEPFDGYITFDFTVTSSGGTVDFRFKWERSSNAVVSNSFIEFANSNPDEIFSELNDFKTAGFQADDTIVVSGSTSNDGTYTIASVNAGRITLIGSDTLVDEGAGAAVTITATFEDLPDNVEALVAVSSSAQSITKTFPLKAQKGDQIRPLITRNSGTSGITTSYATIYASQ